jgi:hypothetical protein
MLRALDLRHDALDHRPQSDHPFFHRTSPPPSAPYGGAQRNSRAGSAQEFQPSEAEIVEEMGRRVAAWMRDLHPRNTAKEVARALNVSEHTTKRVLEGQLPQNRLLVTMIRVWGKRFAAYLLEPAVGPWLMERSPKEARRST